MVDKSKLFLQLCHIQDWPLLFSVLLTDVDYANGGLSIKADSLLEAVVSNKNQLRQLDLPRHISGGPTAEQARKLCLAIISSNIENSLLEYVKPEDIKTHILPHLTIGTKENVQNALNYIQAADTQPQGNDPNEPFLLVEPIYNSKDGSCKFVIPSTATNFLKKITKPVVVVSVAGKYRTGKSYLLNRLYGKQHGFGLGATVQGCTRGVHAWVRSCPDKPHDIILLDTQGLDDVKRHSALFDVKILIIAMVLSSYFIFNGTNVIDINMLSLLEFSVNITNSLWEKKSSGVLNKIKSFFVKPSPTPVMWPKFMLLLRDFVLELPTVGGKKLTATEYMEQQLQQAGFTSSARQSFVTAFPPSFRACRTLPRPIVDERQLRNLERIPFEVLNKQFRDESTALVKDIFDAAPTFNAKSGAEWRDFAESFLEFLNTTKAPEIENAFTATCNSHNLSIQRQVVSQYLVEMATIKFPTNEDKLNNHHAAVEQKLKTTFKERMIGTTVDKAWAEIVKEISKHYAVIKKKNHTASTMACTELVKTLTAQMRTQNKNTDWLKAEYNRLSAEMGPAKSEICQKMIDTDGASVHSKFTSFFSSLSNKITAAITQVTTASESLKKAQQDQAAVNQELQSVTNSFNTFKTTQSQQEVQLRAELAKIQQDTANNNTQYQQTVQNLNARLANATLPP